MLHPKTGSQNIAFNQFITVQTYLKFQNIETRVFDFNTAYQDLKVAPKNQANNLDRLLKSASEGLLSLKIYTASGSLSLPFIPESDGFAIANKLLFEVERSEKSWM